MNGLRLVPILLLLCILPRAGAQERRTPGSEGPELTGGMGVCAVDAPDLTGWINNTTSGADRIGTFTTAVEFFAAAGIRLSGPWRLKAEYGYLLTSFNRTGQLGPAEFSVAMHLPSILVEYVFLDEGMYLFKAAAGAGIHFGEVEQRYAFLDTRFTSQGPGFVAALEGNTALSEDLFAYLGLTARWEALGELRDQNGGTAGGSAYSPAPTLMTFAFGARLGLSLYL